MRTVKFTLLTLALILSLGLKAQQNTQPKFRIALNGGYSYRLAKMPDDVPMGFEQYLRKLKSGYNLGADAHYFFSSWGIGASYNRFATSNEIANVQATDADNITRTGNMTDNIAINFVGPSIANRHISKNNKHIFIGALALGYMNYTNEATFASQQLRINGNTFGYSIDATYDYQVAQNIYIGAKLGLFAGLIKNISYTANGTTVTKDLVKNEYEGLNRLDVSAGIKFHFNTLK